MTMAALNEIRVARTPKVEVMTDGGWLEGYLWALETPGRCQELEMLVKFGNTRYGNDSHWIEARPGPSSNDA